MSFKAKLYLVQGLLHTKMSVPSRKKKNTLKSPPHQHLSSKLPLINVIQRHLTPKLAYFRKRKYRVLQDTHDKAIGLMSQFIACSFCPFLFSHLSCSPSVKTTVSDNVAAYINLYKGKDHFTQVSLKKISSWSFCLFFFFNTNNDLSAL